MNHEIPIPLLRFLGACMYGDAVAFYLGLSGTERALLDSQGRKFGLTAWFYRYLHDVLPETERAKYRKDYQMQQVRALTGKRDLDRLCGVLRDNGQRFVLIKGADLAYRAYPDTALRMFYDWDVWFHPDDCTRALDVLAADGWRIPEWYTDSHNVVMRMNLHHYSVHIRGGQRMEPHFTLPNIGGAIPRELWEETAALPGGGSQRVLSPELNLLMLARHAAGKSYFHASLPKFLTDVAAVMKKEPADFAKLRALSGRLRLPYPGDFFAAFPEFFPPEVIEGFGADPERAAQCRIVFEKRSELKKPNNVALLLTQFAARGSVMSGVLDHIRQCGPYRMRKVFQLPKHGAWRRLAWAYVWYFWSRTWRVVAAWFRRDRGLKEYVLAVEALETCENTPDTGKKLDRTVLP